MTDADAVSGFHAHVYFDRSTLEQARSLCERAQARFGLVMGRVHEKPVGPHPDWSCQLAFTPDIAGAVFAWLAVNRGGLVVFIHPETGNDLADHTDHAIWMGAIRDLDTSMFTKT
ncbi:MAG: DOPA 4,5-dioxygenase family protein [Pseudomonadota bacterium]